MKILLIDDSRVLRSTQEIALIRAGYTVVCASDGEEGLRMAREESPDVIILDMMLPKIAGPDVLRTLKRDPRTKHIPVVALSGLSDANARRLMAEGAVEFVEKKDRLFEDNSREMIEILNVILSRTSRVKEIGWH